MDSRGYRLGNDAIGVTGAGGLLLIDDLKGLLVRLRDGGSGRSGEESEERIHC